MTEKARKDIESWAEELIASMRDVAERGFVPTTLERFGADFFFGDFEWDERCEAIWTAFKGHSEFPSLRIRIKEKIGIDLGSLRPPNMGERCNIPMDNLSSFYTPYWRDKRK